VPADYKRTYFTSPFHPLSCRTRHRIDCLVFLFIKIHQPHKNIHTVNAVKQAENKLVQ